MNITYRNGVGYGYDASHKHAVAGYNGVYYYYDANGCMTTRGNQTIKYDPESRPVRVDAPGTICRFAYDGDGVRRKRLDSSGTIHYVGPYERNVGNGLNTAEVVTKYYSASFGNMTRVIAFRKNGTLYWVGTDHLGGTIRVADGNFNSVDLMRYKPWGESRDAGTNLNTDHLFTSQIKDASIGLYWYASRAYDPALSRFVAPDTIVPSAANPQALNRYSYVLNNPVKHSDPSGHFAFVLPALGVMAAGAAIGAIGGGVGYVIGSAITGHKMTVGEAAAAVGAGAVGGALAPVVVATAATSAAAGAVGITGLAALGSVVNVGQYAAGLALDNGNLDGWDAGTAASNAVLGAGAGLLSSLGGGATAEPAEQGLTQAMRSFMRSGAGIAKELGASILSNLDAAGVQDLFAPSSGADQSPTPESTAPTSWEYTEEAQPLIRDEWGYDPWTGQADDWW